MRERANPSKRSRAGSAFVELALVLGMLMLILVGTIDFARLFFAAVTVASAARAGVQYGSQSNTFTGDYDGMKTAADENAQDLDATTPSAVRFCKCENGNSVDCVTGTCAEGVPQIYVRVEMQKVFDVMVDLPGIPSTTELTRQATFRVQ